MDSATITALCTGIVGILGAITSMIIAVKAHARATTARNDAKEAGTLANATQESLDQHKSVHIIGGTQ